MKKKGFIILGIVIVALVVTLDSISPKDIVWAQTYNEKESNPFDLKVFYDQLESIFKQKKVTTIKSTFYQYYQKNDTLSLSANNIYINIDQQYIPDINSETNLLDFIGNGNTAFISANRFSKTLLDSLKINQLFKTKNLVMVDSLKVTINKNNNFLKFNNKFKYNQSYFKDSSNVKSLGKVFYTQNDSTNISETNFISVKYKKGLFYLHTQPEIFTNYHLLNATNTKYINQLLSAIPSKILSYNKQTNKVTLPTKRKKSTVFFESNYKFNNTISNSPLRFIKSQKALYFAWILVLIGIALFLLINSKRKQRIIPIIPKVRNTSVDFIETIATLYEEADNFQPMILQKIHIFYKNIRKTYHIVTDKTNTKLVSQLSLKSGYDIKKTKELIRFINTLKTRKTSSITLLKKLNKEIEDFNKNTNAWKN